MVTLALLLILGSGPPTDKPAAKGWRGIVPLHSTRADVEKLLGPGTPPGQGNFKYGYYLDDVNVFFHYSLGDCKSGRGVWDLPRDVVIWITVHQKPTPQLSDLQIDLNKFKKSQKGHLREEIHYENEEEGLTLVVYEGLLQTYIYGPSRQDARLRCP